MSRYRYEDMSDDQFEELVVAICRSMLGRATHGFTKGPDGGRDARFDGTANDYPSRRDPWVGTTIIQAKHTSHVEASFSDNDFIGSGKVLDQELPRIKSLADSGELEHYMLFSNRKLPGRKGAYIIQTITSTCGLDASDVAIMGIESIDTELEEHPEIADRLNLDYLVAPLRITRDALAEVIDAMRDAVVTSDRKQDSAPIDRTRFERKNELNEAPTDEMEELRQKYLKETYEIDKFLQHPANRDLLTKYNEAVDELNDRLPRLIQLHNGFMGAYHAIYDIMVNHSETLRVNHRLVRSVQFYMYWSCDFGRSEGDDRAD